jgi:mRNA interferase YafQ
MVIVKLSQGIGMNYKAIPATKFEQDVKRMERRGKDMQKLREIIRLLLNGDPLPPKVRDHPLSGEWKHFRDCHIEPDWGLIYKIEGETLHLVRTGTHADLFG